MKRLWITLITLFVLYTIYYDFNTGTLQAFTPHNETISTEVFTPEKDDDKKQKEENISLSKEPTIKEVVIKPGATVLSIAEKIHKGPLPVSIEQLVNDFKILNPDVSPKEIQIGKVYKFPVYPN